MPYYKGVYFPDGSVPMSHADISALEASSIDDSIGNIRYGGFVDTVANIIERDEKYPTPSEGFPIWLADAGCEQRYVGGRWVGYSEGMLPVPIQSAVPSGTGSTFKLLGVGGIEFTNCNSIVLNNIFTNDFENYKIVVNINSASIASQMFIRPILNGADSGAGTAIAIRAAYGADSATPYVAGSTGGDAIVPMSLNSSTRNTRLELNLMQFNKRYYPLGFAFNNYNDNSTISGITKVGFQINNANAPAFDGIRIYNNNNSLMTGNAKVYGYN